MGRPTAAAREFNRYESKIINIAEYKLWKLTQMNIRMVFTLQYF